MSSGYGFNGGIAFLPLFPAVTGTNKPPLTTRPIAVLPLLARSAGLLRRQHELRRHLWQEEVRARARGLLRVSAPQEGGAFSLDVVFKPCAAG